MTEKKPVPEYPYLDLRCREILVSLVVLGRKIRFKNLHEFIVKNGFFLSKPTLVKHLNHLLDNGLIIRKVEEAHNVTYEINHKIFSDLEKTAYLVNSTLNRIAKEDQSFNSSSLDDQMNIILEKMMLRNLRRLKTNVELELFPAKRWEKLVELEWLAKPVFRHHEGLLIAECKKDREYAKKTLLKLDELINEMKKC